MRSVEDEHAHTKERTSRAPKVSAGMDLQKIGYLKLIYMKPRILLKKWTLINIGKEILSFYRDSINIFMKNEFVFGHKPLKQIDGTIRILKPEIVRI